MKKTARKKAGTRPRGSGGDDPVVKEVRAVRARLLKKGGGTVAGYFRAMDEVSERRAMSGGKRRRSA
ncbi:MAG TPA: hypothetical protein VD997_06520 [Phycisphaerales bacterium]|nr:hypothetical protein [Phycisphaerales bacterium]